MNRPAPPRELDPGTGFRLAGILGAGLIRLWGSTLQVEWRDVRGARLPGRREGKVLYAFWHRAILPLAYLYGTTGAVVLVSRHRDGEFISQMICRLGMGVVRGSTTRGGLRALIEMVRIGRSGHPLAVTPDGPRGPARVLQGGILHIAQRSGLPIHPLAVEATRRTELDSWDRFEIPHPWSQIVVVAGDPITISVDASPESLDRDWAPRVAAGLDACGARAALWRAERIGAR
jgi:hypothetical protein